MGEPWWVPLEVLLMVAAAGGLVWTWWRDGESRELYWSAGLRGCRVSGWRPGLSPLTVAGVWVKAPSFNHTHHHEAARWRLPSWKWMNMKINIPVVATGQQNHGTGTGRGSFLKPTDRNFSCTTDFDLQLDGEATIELFTDCRVFLEGASDYKPPEYCRRVHIHPAPLQSGISALQNVDYIWIWLSEILEKAEFMEELKMLNTFVKYSQELNQNPLVCFSENITTKLKQQLINLLAGDTTFIYLFLFLLLLTECICLNEL